MNTQTKSSISTLSKADSTHLTTVVNETIAFVSKEIKSFTAADLWNIQRQKRSFVPRRYNAA